MELKKSNNPIFDPRLGGHWRTGSRFRDPKTGRLVFNPYWFCYKSPVGAHHWIVQSFVGVCKYCHKEKGFDSYPKLKVVSLAKEKLKTE